MWSRGFIFLIGGMFTYMQLLDSQLVSADTYVAELMVESNVTLDAQTILSILSGISNLTVLDSNSNPYVVNISGTEMVAECLIVGSDTSCNCSLGYIFSNEICYNYNCCRETTCTQNVSYVTPLCVKKVPVYVNGSVTLNMAGSTWDSTKSIQLGTAFQKLNGFESLNVTAASLGRAVADFEVGLSVRFDTARLQSIINTLQTTLMAFIQVDTTGLVYIDAPSTKVCYQSSPILKCTFEEASGLSGWNMSTPYSRFELNNGSVVKLDSACKTPEFQSCVAVTLMMVTSVWEGTYECGFNIGLVRHTARSYLSVARLPDSILLIINPLTADCSTKPTSTVSVTVTAVILQTNNSYSFQYLYNNKNMTTPVTPTVSGTNLNYVFTVPVSCVKTLDPQNATVIFTNDIGQKKNATVPIPVIYAGVPACLEETLNGEVWPKTPSGDTAVNNTCEVGRVGYKTRTCNGTTWQPVFNYCINQELSKISNAAQSFLEGLGATQSVAEDIFAGLQNNTMSSSGSNDNIADLTASIGVLNMMKKATGNIVLGPSVLPSFVTAASNMLNKTWSGVNETVRYTMSASYLNSLEGLVQNIDTNGSTDSFNRPNLDLKYCSGDNCSVDVFGIDVNLNKTKGIMKTVAVKNLMDKLRNEKFQDAEVTNILVSTTLEPKSTSSILIKMQFLDSPGQGQRPRCVYWDTTVLDWSDGGCQVKSQGNGSGVICECTHLTSFSVLMARGDVSSESLDNITYIGLAVSIVSLIIFLIIEYMVWGVVIKTKLSHYRHTAMVNIAFFLLLADISFLASIKPTSLSKDMCLTMTLCKHLFFLVMFSWMLCLSVMLVHQLIFVFNPLRKKVFMFFSSIVGYISPIIIVGSSYVYYKYTSKPYYNPDVCWLTYESLLVGSLHSFLLPVGTILLTNIFSMGVVIMTLLKSSSNDSSKATEKETAKSIIKVIIVLTPVFGVTWSIGFCLVVFNPSNPAYPFFNYTFTIINSFQGLFVLLTGCFSEQKVKDELIRIITGKKGTSDSTKNLTSTTYTKDK